MPHFDRFDICEAYLALEHDWNVGGVLQERPRNQRGPDFRRISVGYQLEFRMDFQVRPSFNGYESLSDNGKEIYEAFCRKRHLCPVCEGVCWDEFGESCDTRLATGEYDGESNVG